MSTKTPKKRNVDKKILQYISAQPCMELAGNNVSLNISSRCLEIKSLETNEIIARHDMPRISFASGGDAVRPFQISVSTINLFSILGCP
jgi:SHC-transforming protein 1